VDEARGPGDQRGQQQDELLRRVTAVARRFGVGPGEVVEVRGGVANRGFVVGDRLFVRVARAGFEGDLRKEVEVVPVARAAGVLTPAIVEYDDSRTVIDAPYVVMERVHGIQPVAVPTGLAEQLARLHHDRRNPEPPAGRESRQAGVGLAEVSAEGWGKPVELVDELVDGGVVDGETGDCLTGWFGRLQGRIGRSRSGC
jgi:hygromycin-B 7''-O-kinase